jgi:non-heme chloroperoxidase
MAWLRRRKSCVLALSWLLSIAGTACAQDIVGDWQGTLESGRKFRIVLQIRADANGGRTANLFSIDQSSVAIPVESVALSEGILKFRVPRIRGRFQGTLAANGASIRGTWTQANGEGSLDFVRATTETAWALDQSPHQPHFVEVESGVRVEVLDWGGSGPPLVLLAGLGDSAHVFDQFAPKLTSRYRVYGITRRGFGASDTPIPVESNYSPDRLGDDVLAVMSALKLTRPLLVGHSIAGEELSSIGSRYPERVAGLVYLDAGYSYAFYDKARPSFDMELLDLRRSLTAAKEAISPQEERTLLTLIAQQLSVFETSLKQRQQELEGTPDLTAEAIQKERSDRGSRQGKSARAILNALRPHRGIRCPVLALFAVPHRRGGLADAQAEAKDLARVEPLVKAFESGFPQAKVVRLPYASHYVFGSNEGDVIRELDSWVATLK